MIDRPEGPSRPQGKSFWGEGQEEESGAGVGMSGPPSGEAAGAPRRGVGGSRCSAGARALLSVDHPDCQIAVKARLFKCEVTFQLLML